MAVSVETAEASALRMREWRKPTIATDASSATIAMTTISSISVKPESERTGSA